MPHSGLPPFGDVVNNGTSLSDNWGVNRNSMNLKLLFLLFTAVAGGTLAANDLTTRDGTTYSDYKVISHDDGYITIVYADGDGKIRLSNLPDALQKQYGYDPIKAKAAVATEESKWNLVTCVFIGLALVASFCVTGGLFRSSR